MITNETVEIIEETVFEWVPDNERCSCGGIIRERVYDDLAPLNLGLVATYLQCGSCARIAHYKEEALSWPAA